VTDDAGETHAFGKLLLATGGAPRTLAPASDRVIYFRTLDDYRRLRELTRNPARVVVLGGGFIGTEIAAALRWSGHQVTMLVPEQGLCARQFPADLATALVEYYREKGVNVRLGQSVAAMEDRGKNVTLRSAGGDELVADVVVAGLGIIPETALAEQAGLKVDHGILVDDLLRTGHPDVYAAGDVAVFQSHALGRRMRVEHEDNAATMGRLAGRNMAGDTAPYRHLPFFYSDLFELGYEAVGELDARHQVVAHWKERFREGVLYYLNAGQVRGVLLWNTWGKVDAARALIGGPAAGRLS
jgi:NAD(P)H-nitrite reductase large subunit